MHFILPLQFNSVVQVSICAMNSLKIVHCKKSFKKKTKNTKKKKSMTSSSCTETKEYVFKIKIECVHKCR